MSLPVMTPGTLAGKLYWAAVCLSAVFYGLGLSIFPIEAVLVSLFTSALAYPLISFTSGYREANRGSSFMRLVFSMFALGTLLALLFTLRLFVLDAASIATVALFSISHHFVRKQDADFATLSDSFAVASLYLIIQQPPSFLTKPGDEWKTAFFYVLSFGFMGGSAAYKFRALLGTWRAIMWVIVLPLVWLAVIYAYPYLAGPVAVLYLAIPQILKGESAPGQLD